MFNLLLIVIFYILRIEDIQSSYITTPSALRKVHYQGGLLILANRWHCTYRKGPSIP
jgi:hypothetical protein